MKWMFRDVVSSILNISVGKSNFDLADLKKTDAGVQQPLFKI